MTVENKSFIKYAAKLIILYLLLDYGTTLFIGITTQGGIYIEWLDKYFNYVAWLRHSILSTAKFVMYLLGYETHIHSTYILQIKNGSGVRMVYSCIGYGVLCFWAAFILVNKGKFWFKTKWLISGLIIIFITNVLRVVVLLIALQKKMFKPFTLDHHTFYNIVAYLIVIGMMLLFLKQLKKQQTQQG